MPVFSPLLGARLTLIGKNAANFMPERRCAVPELPAANTAGGRSRRSDVLHRHHDEGVEFAVVVADRHVLARHEAVAGKLEAGLVAFVAVDVVGEAPRAPGAVDEMADIVL